MDISNDRENKVAAYVLFVLKTQPIKVYFLILINEKCILRLPLFQIKKSKVMKYIDILSLFAKEI